MNRLLKIAILGTLFGSIISANSIGVCKGCHGQEFKKSAQSKSKILKNMSRDEIQNALEGYKNGTYGGVMKSVMQAQVKRLSEEDIKKLVDAIKN